MRSTRGSMSLDDQLIKLWQQYERPIFAEASSPDSPIGSASYNNAVAAAQIFT